MDKIHFIVNGEPISLSAAGISPTTSLNDYLRKHLNLTGTKSMCHEGGCGLCIVSVNKKNPVTKEKEVFSVNSCLVHILSCHQWEITTVEGISSPVNNEYHPLQKRLALFNGSQCGYCSPGWVMNMYSLYEGSKYNLTMEDVERSFGANICRCTGYRPILDAFKTFTTDVNDELKKKLTDLEDLDKLPCPCYRISTLKHKSIEFDKHFNAVNEQAVKQFNMITTVWYKAYKIKDVFEILSKEDFHSYRLVAGNTGQGVYPITNEPKVLIDISSIEELYKYKLDEHLELGGGMNITDVMEQFRILSKDESFRYLAEFEQHLVLVAHIPVRNIGTLAGNLALKNAHPEFPSDIFLLLDTVEASVTIVEPDLNRKTLSMAEFLKADLNNKLILSVNLPPLEPSYLVRTYKIMPRAQNAHAIVNAGFMFELNSDNKVMDANITYGNISRGFHRATNTVKTIIDHNLFTNEALEEALQSLSNEISPVEMLPEPSPLCRKTIALGLFYKAILSFAPVVSDRFKSGGELIEREISSGVQSFDTDRKIWPLNEPVCKLEGIKQCAGELKYTCDVTTDPRELFVAFVTSTICVGTIERIDASDALLIPGVMAFYKAEDIAGKNTFTPKDVLGLEFEEEILASTTIAYNGQPIGLIVATDQSLAWKAAKMVKATYRKSAEQPVLCVRDALNAPDRDERLRLDAELHQQEMGKNVELAFEGSYYVPSQFHYTMERQCARVDICGDSIKVTASTQWPDLVQVAVAKALDIAENKVEVSVAGVGGGYGGKASRSALPAAAAALVARLHARPVAVTLSLTDDMNIVGKRMACDVDYQVTVNSIGRIQSLHLTYYSDCGYNYNDTSAPEILAALTNLYNCKRWKIVGYSVKTDKASNTWCRAPSTTEGTAIAEHIMERIAIITDEDPVEVRLMNMDPKHEIVHEMTTTFKSESHYLPRKIEINRFNLQNAWKKRGISLSMMSYPISYSGNFSVTISVYYTDGSIIIGHGGIEMGQGINTKLAQVCAYKLKVPLEKITVRGFNSFVSPNMMVSSGSITSDSVAFACVKACEILLDRMKPVKEQMNAPTWEEVIKEAYERGISLQSTYMMSELDHLEGYNVYGICSCEVELDCLTGTFNCLRVHILEDTGVSLSPDIDVGQIEGAFVMGLGLWTSENLVFDKSTGKLLTDRTWTYKPPGIRDIPTHFTVGFLRNSFNKAGVLRSKATGEPALTLSVVVTQALHQAILEARKEHGYDDMDWVHVDTPYSVENILKAISPKIESYKLTIEVTPKHTEDDDYEA